MTPFFIVVGSWALFAIAGRMGVPGLDSPKAAGCAAFAVMFGFTGATHFSPMRYDYLAMVPDFLPGSMGMIYVSGVLEIAGAIGLLVPRTRRISGILLILLLVALFPANVFAALNQVPFRGEPPTPLLIRGPIQLVFVLGLWWSAIRTPSPVR